MNEIINKFKNNSFLRIISELFLATLLFNINIYVGLAIFLIIVLEILFCKDIYNLLYIFAFMAFNDEILILEQLHGSISRVFLVLISLKLIVYILKNKLQPKKSSIAILAFFIISSIIDLSSIKEEFIIY